MDAIAETLLSSFSVLSENRMVRSLLAENMGCGGVERLFQSCLVWAINTEPSLTVLGSTEKRVLVGDTSSGEYESPVKTMDLVLFRRTPTSSEDWWKLFKGRRGAASPSDLAASCDAFIEIKPVSPEPYISFTADEVASEVDGDVNSLRAGRSICLSRDQAEKRVFIILLLVAYYPFRGAVAASPPVEAEGLLCRCEDTFWAKTRTLVRSSRLDDRWILRGDPYTSDPRRKMFMKAVLIDALPAAATDPAC